MSSGFGGFGVSPSKTGVAVTEVLKKTMTAGSQEWRSSALSSGRLEGEFQLHGDHTSQPS